MNGPPHPDPSKDTGSSSDFHLFTDGALRPCSRELVAEEPLVILLGEEPLATLMRTPGHEEELALGFLLTEGIIASPEEVGAISFCPDGETGGRNEARVHPASGAKPKIERPQHRRNFSSCGICGADMIEEAAEGIPPFEQPAGRLTPDEVFRLAEAMKAAQETFRRTGGTHAAALASLPISDRSSVIVREDIGRHNAIDKTVGAAARRGGLSADMLLMLSGRLSFDMVTKAARAGIANVAGVSAPSALAVRLARKLNVFLAGFVRGRAMTVYSGAEALRT